MASKKSKECVKVAVRCRPMSTSEMADNRKMIVSVDTKRNELRVQNVKNDGTDPVKTFTFDYVYDYTSNQDQIYQDCAYPIVDSVLEGYNGTIFAYGQTGTGKTHTMEGNPKQKGIIPRTFDHIFRRIEGSPDQKFLVRVSMLELYNEEIRDLLSKHHTHKLELREKDSGVYVKDLSMHVVNSVAEMTQKLDDGRGNRVTAETKMNEHSSRSHCLYAITIENCEANNPEAKFRMGKLNLVDLAGSEKQKKTGAEGKRLDEAKSINLSLTILGNVISSLTDPKCTHVPYRDSKLTRLLQDSLGGNARTFMIANIGPADYNFDETMSTLRYAHRAKSIQNIPKINEDPKDAMLREYQEEIAKLKEALAMAGGAGGGAIANFTGSGPMGQKIIKVQDEEKIKEMEEKLAREKEEIRIKAEMERKKIEQEKTMAEDEKLLLLEKLNKKEDEERKQKEQREKMLKKLKKMESKMLVGNKVMEKAMLQERELMEAKQILENQRINQQRMEEELRKNEDMKMEIQKKFSSQQEEIDVKTKRLQKIMENYNSVKAELNDIQDTFNREREELIEQNREYQKSLKLKDLIIHHFIPDEEVQKLEARAEWSDDKDDWLIPLSVFTGRSIRNKAMQSVYGIKRPIAESSMMTNPDGTRTVRDPKAAFENIAHFDLDLPEETTDDFGTASDHPPASRAAILASMNNDEDELRLIQTEIHPNVYFVYTDEGAIRAKMVTADKKPERAPARKPSAAPKRQPSAVVRKEDPQKMEEDFIPKGKGLVRKKI